MNISCDPEADMTQKGLYFTYFNSSVDTETPTAGAFVCTFYMASGKKRHLV